MSLGFKVQGVCGLGLGVWGIGLRVGVYGLGVGLVEFLFTGLYRAKKGIEEKPGGYQPRTVTWDFWRFKGWYGCSRFYKCVYGISST